MQRTSIYESNIVLTSGPWLIFLLQVTSIIVVFLNYPKCLCSSQSFTPPQNKEQILVHSILIDNKNPFVAFIVQVTICLY